MKTEFKKWFGNSKVIDKKSNPLIVYHGTKSNFYIFKPSKKKGNQGELDQIEGIHFTDSKKGASFYALNENDDRFLKKVYLSIQKPYKANTYRELQETFQLTSYSKIGRQIRNEGYDGILIENGFYSNGGPYKLFLVFEANQIKYVEENL